LKTKKIKSVCAGGYHFIVVTVDGEAYTWGTNTYGPLGHGNLDSLTEPTLISNLVGKKITSALAGVNHSMFFVQKSA